MQRRQLSEEQWQAQSAAICAALRAAPQYQQARTVLAYFSFRREPDLSALFAAGDRRWGFPRCVDRALTWHSWATGDGLEIDRYGIQTPLASAPQLSPEMVDLILVPTVACDRRGYRLGYGGGFYDRLLSDPRWAAKPTVGIVFAIALLDALPVDGWDRPLSGVCCETGLEWFGPSC